MTKAIRRLAPLLLLTSGPSFAAAPPMPELAGTWAEMRVFTAVTKTPFIGTVTTKQRLFALYRIGQKGKVLEVDGAACGIRFDSSLKRLKTSVAPSFLKALGPLRGTPALSWNDKDKRWELSTKQRTRLLGVKLKKPDTDKLPTRADDPRVVDADKDGKPGVTVSISGLASGDIYLVQRLRWRTRSVVTSKDAIDGLVEWTRDQYMLGGSTLMLNRSGPGKGKPHADKTQHTVSLRRVPPTTSCADVLKRDPKAF